MSDYSWMERAACRGVDIEVFYSEEPGDESRALELCLACAVRSECYEAAMASREAYGVWGGTAGRQRRRIFRRERRSSTPRPQHPAAQAEGPSAA